MTEEQERDQAHREALADWDAEFKRQTGKDPRSREQRIEHELGQRCYSSSRTEFTQAFGGGTGFTARPSRMSEEEILFAHTAIMLCGFGLR